MTSPSPSQRSLRLSRVLAAMVLAMCAVGALAYWDEDRESAAALEDLGDEQAVLASSVAANLSARLAGVRRDAQAVVEANANSAPVSPSVSSRYAGVKLRSRGEAPAVSDDHTFTFTVPGPDGAFVDLTVPRAELLEQLTRIERPSALMVVVALPGAHQLLAIDGRQIDDPALLTALAEGRSSMPVERARATHFGLPERMAVAGLARVDGGPLGRWGIGVITSALRMRDRERRDRFRLVLSVVLAGGLVLAFGAYALRTQRKELELSHELTVAEIARAADERLERLGKMATLVTLASGVAHEVSTPLGVIVGRAEQLLPRVKDDERASRAAQEILDQAERIKQVVRGFLTLARDGTPNLERVSAAGIVSGATALVEHRFEKAGVTLKTGVRADLPAVGGDPRLLEHALVNLLLNACDASAPAGRVEVNVYAQGDELAIDVTDEGAGIAPADAERATELFFTTKPAGQGTGLGLAIANEIIKSHHGSLSIQPAERRGTRASLRIPLAHGELHGQT